MPSTKDSMDISETQAGDDKSANGMVGGGEVESKKPPPPEPVWDKPVYLPKVSIGWDTEKLYSHVINEHPCSPSLVVGKTLHFVVVWPSLGNTCTGFLACYAILSHFGHLVGP